MDLLTFSPNAPMLARTVLGAVFVVAALEKFFANGVRFVESVQALGVHSERHAKVIAGLLPRVEFLIGVALIASLVPAIAVTAALGLLSVFTVAIVLKLSTGAKNLKCGCFGYRGNLSWMSIFRNLALALLGMAALSETLAPRYLLAALVVTAVSVCWEIWFARWLSSQFDDRGRVPRYYDFIGKSRDLPRVRR